MTTRDTSIEAFRSIQPQLSEKQAAVLAVLERSHALTDKELARELGWEINTITPRRGELADMGLVQRYGKRHCRVTGSKAWAWGIAKDAPIPTAPPKFVPISVLIDGIRVTRFVPESG